MSRKPCIAALAVALALALAATAAPPVKVAVFRNPGNVNKQSAVVGVYERLKAEKGIEPRYVSAFTPAALGESDVLIVSGSEHPRSKLSAPEIEAVRKWVAAGRGLLVTHNAVGYRRRASFFPELSQGTGNPFRNRLPFSKEICVARRHPVTRGSRPGERILQSYFDYVTIAPGKGAVVLARGVDLAGDAAVSSAAVIICATHGKGRYVADGQAVGSLAPGGYATKPLGGAGKLLRNEVLWLAGRVNDPAPGEDIGKGLRLGEATPNLARNGDAEQGEDGRPAPGWGCYTGAGKGTWGTTTRAAHTGHKSVFLKALEPVTRKRRDRYTNKLKPVTLTSVALMQGESDGYRGPKAYDVLPDMRYRVSFWVKGDPANKPQPKITVFVQTWESEDGSVRSRKAIYPHNKARAFPVSPDWRRFAFTLHPRSPKARKMALKIQMAGDPATLPPGATIYVDDVRWVPEYVQGLQGVSIAGVRAGCEERVRPAWRRSRGPTPAITKLAVGTEMPINADGVPLRTALYDPKPEGWQRLDLAGMWKIKKLPGTRDNPANDLGAREGFHRIDYDDTAWDTRPVPSSWDRRPPRRADQLAEYRAGNVGYGNKAGDFHGVGWYRTSFTLPAREPVRRVVLNFRGAVYETTVFLNGRKVGRNPGGAHPFEFDATDIARSGGRNVLAVRIFDDPRKAMHEESKVGGLFGEVFVDLRPSVYLRDLYVTPRLKTSTLEVDAVVVNPTGGADPGLTASVTPSQSNRALGETRFQTVARTPLGLRLKPGDNAVTFRVKLPKPVLWSLERPYLYTLRVERKGRVVAKERFGFREFRRRGRFFYLNGGRVKLMGECFNRYNYWGFEHILLRNKNNSLRRILKAHKDLNINTIYTRSPANFLPRQFYDVCDEMGLLAYEFLAFPLEELKNPNPEVARRRYLKRYNHPSFVMMALVAECQQRIYVKPVNRVYRILKAVDKQQRPICSISGGAPSRVVFETDVADIHCYPGVINAQVQDFSPLVERYNRNVWQHVGKNLPVISWEIAGGLWTPQARQVAIGRRLLSQARVDKEALLNVMVAPGDFYGRGGYSVPLGLAWLSVYGIRQYLFEDHAQAKAERSLVPSVWQRHAIKGELEEARRLGDLCQGTGLNISPEAMFRLKKGDKVMRCTRRGWKPTGFARSILDHTMLTGPACDTIRRSYSPRFVCLGLYGKNVFAGGDFTATVYAVNDTPRTSAPWSLRAVIKAKDGRVLSDRTANVGRVKSFKRKLLSYAWRAPAALPSEHYFIEVFLVENGKPVCDNREMFFVLGRDDIHDRIDAGARRVALYDRGAGVVGKGGVSTGDVLDRLKVRYAPLKSFADLERHDVLIIGRNSSDVQVDKAGPAIRRWIERGGRVLQFEQSGLGRVAFLPRRSLVKHYGGGVADLIVIDHPLFKGITRPDNWDRWAGDLPEANHYGRHGGIYATLIAPIDKTVLATACNAVPRTTPKAVQMLISEERIGKGVALLIQAEATRRYGRDSVATKLIQNALRHILSTETRYAMALGPYRIETVNRLRCAYLDLSDRLNVELKDVDPDWAGRVAKRGLGNCGGVHFRLGNRALHAKGRVRFDLTRRMKLMYPKWEAEYLKRDKNQLGLMLDAPDHVYFFHRSVGARDGEVVGAYTFVYSDGSRVREPIVAGENIANADARRDLKRAKYAGQGFYVASWTNPTPNPEGKRVKELIVESPQRKLVLGAVTGSLLRKKIHD